MSRRNLAWVAAIVCGVLQYLIGEYAIANMFAAASLIIISLPEGR